MADQEPRKGILKPGQTLNDMAGLSVINLSNKDLDSDSIDVLSRGLTFCPTPREPNMVDLVNGLDKMVRTMRYRAHFAKIKEDQKYNRRSSKYTNPSSDTQKPEYPVSLKPYKDQPKRKDPGPTNVDLIEAYYKATKFSLLRTKVKKCQGNNLTKGQYTALKNLRADKEITIKKADKGSAVVVMNTLDYIKEAERQLSDLSTYMPLDEDTISPKVRTETEQAIEYMSALGYINPQEKEYLLVHKPTPGRFYLLPKIHKKHAPGRPIVGSNNHVTEKISQFVDDQIRKYAMANPSYIKDTTDFIKKLKEVGPLAPGTLLCTMDVTSLYTNIPHYDGLYALARKLVKDKPNLKVPALVTLKLARLVLSNNVMTFNNQLYLQLVGTAMGTRMAPNYANIFMGRFEQQLLNEYPLKFKLWVRFIDDVFCIWEHGEAELLKFIEYANQQNASIKFTHEYDSKQINFLDTTVKVDTDRTLYTSLYNKPTDTFDYLHYSSAHPSHCKTAGPRGQLIRIRRICKKDTDFEFYGKRCCSHYIRRGYPPDIVDKAFTEISKFTQDDLLKPRERPTTGNKLFFSVPYNPRNVHLNSLIQKHWHLLESNACLNELFPHKPMIGYSRPNNLRDILCKATVNYPEVVSKPNKCTQIKCRRRPESCHICILLNHKQHRIKSSVTQKSYKIPQDITCLTRNVIYCLKCQLCSKIYIGETKRLFETRFKEHLADIRHNRDTPVAQHFNCEGHSAAHVLPTIVEVINKDPSLEETTLFRRERERFWIYQLRSLTPLGINVQG